MSSQLAPLMQLEPLRLHVKVYLHRRDYNCRLHSLDYIHNMRDSVEDHAKFGAPSFALQNNSISSTTLKPLAS